MVTPPLPFPEQTRIRVMNNAARRQRQRDEMLAMTQQLIVEYAGRIPPGSVLRVVARCRGEALRAGTRLETLTATVEAAAQARLTAIVPAHVVA